MPVSLPCGGGRGQSGRGGGRGHDGGRIGRCGCGRRGGPLPSRERNPMLVSNSQNTILLEALAPPLAQAMGQPVSAQQYTNDIAESVHGSKPDPVDAGPLSAHTAIASSLTQSTLMISIHSKNDTAKNNSEYSLDAIKAMRLQITTLVRPILAIVQVERPDSYIDMKNLLNPPNGMQKISK